MTSGEGTLFRAFEGCSSLEPDDLFLVSTMGGSGDIPPAIGEVGKGGLGINHLRTVVMLLRSFSLKSQESESESTSQLTSFMFNAVSKNENGAMLSANRQVLPSRKDDRVILHFDCRYSPMTCIEQYTYNMQLADSAVQR